MDTENLPASWFAFPYPWQTFLGIAMDRGHNVAEGYGDDGQMQVMCHRCHAALWIDNGTVRDRTLLDQPCTVLLAIADHLNRS